MIVSYNVRMKYVTWARKTKIHTSMGHIYLCHNAQIKLRVEYERPAGCLSYLTLNIFYLGVDQIPC